MPKIFILNNEYTGPKSRADLHELVINYGIFKNPEVLECDFSQKNFSGLNVKSDHPIFVFPGGSTIYMGEKLESDRNNIAELVNQGADFIGVCAGGYLATNTADIFYTHYEVNEGKLLPPKFARSNADINLKICNEYQAIGPFYPNNTYANYENKELLKKSPRRPHCTDVSFSIEESIPQLFVEGCGFEKVNNTSDKSFEVVATYKNHYPFQFFYPKEDKIKSIEELPAMIRKKSTEGGRVFLSGTHIETCVEKSTFFDFFTNKSATQSIVLSQDDKIKLESSKERAKEKIVSLLKDTFTR